MVNEWATTIPAKPGCWNSWAGTGSYEPAPATVERIETHASVVFLAGPFAYKVKRAVKYPFLDFSTLERRREACINELRVNRRTADQLYLEVVPVTLGESGDFRFGGDGEDGRMGAENAPLRPGEAV